MSAKLRADAEALRAKYARAFGVPKDLVEIELVGDDNAKVFCPWHTELPAWFLATHEVWVCKNLL